MDSETISNNDDLKREVEKAFTRIKLLEEGLEKANTAIEEAKNLPSVQTAREALASIADVDNKTKNILNNVQTHEKLIQDTQSSAQKKDSDIKALLDAIAVQEVSAKELLKTVSKNLEDKQVELNNLIETSNAQIDDQHKRIESLIPGATSAKLATAFKERKEEVAKGGKGWIILMVVASFGLVAAGVISWICPGSNFWASLPARAIVVVGLLLIEEFARKNYNIKRRLSEAYGYKEVMSRSFHGYKEAMADVSLPKDNSGITCKADEKLVAVFLQTLADEPGKKIFEKEETATFSEKLAAKLVEADPRDDSLIGKLIKENALAKITWPLVALVAIIVAGLVIILCFT